MELYKAGDIAKYVIYYCDEHGYAISNLKLQKLLYFVQAKFLVDANRPCFSDVIEAWDYGPVVPDVYREYRIYGSSNIPCSYDYNHFDYLDRDEIKIMDDILAEVSGYTASQLVKLTHHQSPWIDARNSFSKKISNKSIEEFFK